MQNGIVLTHLATNMPLDIPLNDKEMVLALDKSDSMNRSWEILDDSVYARTGVRIIGNFELDFIIINGDRRPLH